MKRHTDNRLSLPCMGGVKTQVMMLLMLMVAGVGEVTAQVIADGYYRLRNANNGNVYYLCSARTTWQDSKQYITTYKSDSNDNSLWKIVNESGNYYYVIHVASGKYLTFNDAPDSSDENKKRVHLEASDSPDDNMLFEITLNNTTYISFRPKPLAVAGTTRAYLNPHSGNKDDYKGDNGLIGFWDFGDISSRWTPVKVAAPAPTITFDNNANTFSISVPDFESTGVTIHYTTDGSTPTASSSTYTTAQSADDISMVKAIAVREGYSNSSVAEIYTPLYPFLFRNGSDNDFYMLPGDVNSGNTQVTTSSLPRPTMGWRFVDKGIYDDGFHYYNIINKQTGDYLFCNSSGNVYMKAPADATPDADDYKFRLLEDATPGIRILPKSRNLLGDATQHLNKSYGNNRSEVVNIHNSSTDTNERWIFIMIADNTMPNSLRPDPITAWTSEHTAYYKIGAADPSAEGYYVIPTDANGYVNTSNSVTDDMSWYIKEADSDDWSTSYYIINAVTGDYLYYNGTTTGTSNRSNAFNTKAYSSAEEDRYQFYIPKTGKPDQTTNNDKYSPDNLFYIVPKVVKDLSYNDYMTIYRENNKTDALKLTKSRRNRDIKWTFTSTAFKCAPPDITYDETQGTITMTSPNNAPIYYVGYDDGDPEPALASASDGTLYTEPIDAAHTHYKAIAMRCTDGSDASAAATYNLTQAFKCVAPRISHNTSNKKVTITSATTSATIYYIIGEGDFSSTAANFGGTLYENPFDLAEPQVVKAIAIRGTDWSTASDVTIWDEAPHYISASSQMTNMALYYVANEDFVADVTIGTESNPFTGKFDGAYHPIRLSQPLFGYVNGGTVKNLVLEDVNISSGDADGNTGAIACTATGDARIYNIGILSGSVGVSGGNVGSIVGLLDGTARVINCYSYANITSGGSTTNPQKYVGGLVGNNSQTSNQTTIKTIVVNCMFYGEIDTDNCSNYAPVYGNNIINTAATNGINPYCYFRANATFDDNYPNIDAYKRSWPAEEEYLTRFEYYRSILNSNRKLCTWWVGTTTDTVPTDADVEEVGIAKWVLDPSIAPYPILKKWGKYPSIINPDKTQTIDPRTIDDNGNTRTPTWTSRSSTNDYKGGILGTLSVTVNAGSNHAGSKPSTTSITLPITDMDTLNYDYGYYKVQLPYYNELFGDPTSTDHDTRYGGNYKAKVVTGWKITNITGGTPGTFTANWESGYNFADRNCTNKDLYSVSGRVFAQGGFFYVPEGVSAITIEAYWGKAVYLHNSGHYLDRVNITNQSANGNLKLGNPFTPTGTLATTFQEQTVYDSWTNAVKALDEASNTNGVLNKTVYDQAIVLLSNLQWRNENNAVGTNINNNKWYPYTIMSIDQDLDNEPDYCFEFQFRRQWGRPGIQPIRFDFLPVPELGLAVRHNEQQNTIGIFIPQGHFEITETSFMHTTQFEYDGNVGKLSAGAPVILNGGNFEQIVVRYGSSGTTGPANRTTYFIMGGHFRMLRFTPGAHTNTNNTAKVRLCAVNAIGGEYPEFYLSGIYRPDIALTGNDISAQGNPHCYTNGGKFNLIAGAGYDKIYGNITFKIDHSIIGEFYGGGINGSNPVGGSIDVTIDHSLVAKYCGGPKVGTMVTGKTVTTHATGTTFTRFYGGGNGGTSYYRWQRQDGNVALPASTANGWANYGYNTFNPLNSQLSNNKQYEGPDDDPLTPENRGYNALFEFECFVESNGLGENPTIRSYMHWAQFGTTSTGNITNNLNDCTIKENFYGGGNLGNVSGSVSSTLTDCTVNGSVFGGGFSGKIEPFRIHDRTKTEFPYIDKAGIMHNGALYYVKDGVNDRYYTWTNDHSKISGNKPTNTPTFQGDDGKWYVYTTVPLEGLGAVSENTSLIITTTEGGTSTIGTEGDTTTGNVFGGGNESAVDGNTTVTLSGNVNVLGNVFGGGNKAIVGGSSTVNIK